MTAETSSKLRRALGSILFGVAVLVTVTAYRLLVDGSRHLEQAMRLLELKDRKAAVVALEDAAKSYVPGSPFPTKALYKLSVLAKSAEMRGDIDEAIHVWEVLRRSVLGSRHFFQPNAAYLDSSERELKRLYFSGENASAVKASVFELPRDPDPWGSMLLFLGLICWGAGSAALCLLPSSNVPEKARWRTYAWMACLGGLFTWLVAAYAIG